MCYINKCTPYKSAIIANLKGVFLVEARRIELLSENRSANLSTRLVKSFEIPFLLSGSQDRSPVVL